MIRRIVNNRCWSGKSRPKSIVFSKVLLMERNRLKGEIFSKLQEAIRKSIATNVLTARMTKDQYFKAKHEGSVVRAKAHVHNRK